MSDDKPSNLPASWQKVQILSNLIASILIPTVIAIVGNVVNTSLKDQELKLSYIQLATAILNEKPTSENQNLRQWAVDIVNYYSVVALPEAAQRELKSVPLILEEQDDLLGEAYALEEDGNYQDSLQKKEEALTKLQEASEREPNNPVIWLRTGLILEELDRKEEALNAYRKYLQVCQDQNDDCATYAQTLINELQ
ncbi:MAG: hypothetical protein VKJ64_09205 [Leptolyngbyaceae bacterium]|nr:hypothetical protein [Leptolyngbyaceae bacterium]